MERKTLKISKGLAQNIIFVFGWIFKSNGSVYRDDSMVFTVECVGIFMYRKALSFNSWRDYCAAFIRYYNIYCDTMWFWMRSMWFLTTEQIFRKLFQEHNRMNHFNSERWSECERCQFERKIFSLFMFEHA